MTSAVHFDCVLGAAGDMMVAALCDAGVPLAVVEDAVRACGVDAALELADVRRSGLRAAHFQVVPGPSEPATRQFRDILDAVEGSALPDRVRHDARAVLVALGEVEAALHGVPMSEVHLHELAGTDTIVDVIGVCAALCHLDADMVTASPLPAGSGTVPTSHGLLPLPAPATLALLSRAGATIIPGPAEVELVTPTAAALLSVLTRFEPPRMRLEHVGHGAGTRDLPGHANVLRCWVGRPDKHAPTHNGAVPTSIDHVIELRTNLDSASPAVVAHLAEICLRAGALDAWVAPVVMKKGRPGHVLHVLAADGAADALAELLLEEGPTLGVRAGAAHHHIALRDDVEMDTPLGRVRVKRVWRDGAVVDARPELDDCRRLAVEHGLPFHRVIDEITAAARSSIPQLGGSPFTAATTPPLEGPRS